MNPFFTFELTLKVIIITASTALLGACSNNISTTSSTSNKNNKILPRACLDSSKNYKFVKGIIGTGAGSYLDKRVFYSPIESKNGLIKHDFNRDGLIDYLFLERIPSKKTARLVSCISNKSFFGKGYQRQPTSYSIREFKKPSLYIESTRIGFKNNVLKVHFSTHAHNDGGESEVASYVFDKAKKDFVLNKFYYSAFGEVFPEITQEFDFKKQQYKEETGCSFAFNTAAMGYNPNCKPRKIKQCLRPSKTVTIRNRFDHNKFTNLAKKCD